MEGLLREKSWSVKLIEGNISQNKVRGNHCEGCLNNCDLMVNNYTNPNLVLFGCRARKCQHKLIRLSFGAEK
jgi:hypothetical protein